MFLKVFLADFSVYPSLNDSDHEQEHGNAHDKQTKCNHCGSILDRVVKLEL
jgi:hypothetical protein